MNRLLCTAIRKQHVLAFQYNGGDRCAEPHLYGRARTGNELLLAWQLHGSSRSGRHVGWKLFKVNALTRLRCLPQRFAQARPDYDPNDNSVQRIFCRIET
jgi:hypothetical protein